MGPKLPGVDLKFLQMENNSPSKSCFLFAVFANGKQLFEGELNRAIVNGIIQELTFMQIPYFHVCPELEDIRIGDRVNRANENNEQSAFLISVHANTNEVGRPGSGCEFLIYPTSSTGAQIATIFAEEYQREFPDERLRMGDDGEPFKRRGNLGILRRTSMPAIITENFFFNNRRETETYLLTREGRNRIVDYHVAAIVRVLTEVFEEDLEFRD